MTDRQLNIIHILLFVGVFLLGLLIGWGAAAFYFGG